jgi:hypothetical protein
MFLGIASPAWARVEFDTAVYSTAGITNTCQMTLTIGSNFNRALIVGVHTASAGVGIVWGAGAHWASTPAIDKTSASNRVTIWVGTNPSPGIQTVTVNLSATDTDIICGVDSFYGVDQASPTAHAIGKTGSGGTAQVDVTSAPNNMTFGLISHNGNFAGPAGCTATWDWFATHNQLYGQGAHCAGAGTTSFRWTTSSNWSLAGIDVQAVGAGGSVPPWSETIAYLRAIDWRTTNPGVEGGIPNRTTNCFTLGVAGQTPDFPQNNVTAVQINSAIAACPAGQVVLLRAGTYTINTTRTPTPGETGIVFLAKDNVTLRGEGPDRTLLRFIGSGEEQGHPCGGLGGDLCFINGDPNDAGNPRNVADWLSGYDPGTRSILLWNLTGTKPLVGTLLTLDQLDDSDTDNQQLWICQKINICGQVPEGQNPGRLGRGQTQVVRVTAISDDRCSDVNPCAVTISPGLYMPNWRAGQDPEAWWSNSLPITGSGVEDLSMDHTNSSARGGTFIFNGRGIWLKNIRSINAAQKHVWMYQSVHTTVRDSYFYGTQAAASDSYATDTFTGGDQLIENNIFEHVASPMLNEGGQGIVHAYNYAVDDYFTKNGTTEWQQASSYQHAIGNAFLLWEGNDGIAMTADDIHGVSDFTTAFRNYWNGRDPAGGSLAGKTQQTNAIQLQSFNRYYNIIGNVLGTSGYHTLYEVAPVSETDGGNPAASNGSIYSIGWSGNEGTKQTQETLADGQTIPLLNDPLVKTTLFRWGNYDVVTGVRFNANEVPAGLSLYANPVPPNNSLPASFYLPARPSWWGTGRPWPGIGPDVTNGDISAVGGHANTIPARRCRESQNPSLMPPDYEPDPINQPGAFVRTFNANACYPPP